MDAKEALQYVYCVCLCADQPGVVGKEQVENAWELVRRIIVLANAGAAWEELVGGFRLDGTRFVRIIFNLIRAHRRLTILLEWRHRTIRFPAQTQQYQRVQRTHSHPRREECGRK